MPVPQPVRDSAVTDNPIITAGVVIRKYLFVFKITPFNVVIPVIIY
jgi:hypothetical protein